MFCALIWAEAALFSGAKFGEPLFCGRESFFLLAERKTDLGSAIPWVVIEAGARDARDTDFLNEVFGEGDVFCFRSEPRIVLRELQARNVGHDVVSAAWFVNGEACRRKNL